MLQADANFQAANARAVKTPVFKMTFADDPGANQFINLDPVEEPDPVVDPVHSTLYGLVAVGANGEVQTSEDGVTWYHQDLAGVASGSTAAYISAVAGEILICFDAGDYINGQVYRSPVNDFDGSVLFSSQLVQTRFVAFLGSIFYVNYHNHFTSDPTLHSLKYSGSLNGPWTPVVNGFDAAGMRLLATDTALLYYNSAYTFCRSTDGINFTVINTSANISGTLRGWTVDPDTGAIIALVYKSSRCYILTSMDNGQNFTNQGYAYWSSQATLNDQRMACGAGRLIIIDGNNSWVWNIDISDLLAGTATFSHPTNLYGDPIHAVTYAEHLGWFVAVGDAGRIITSSDGLTWTTRTPDSYSGALNFVWGGVG